MVKQRIVILTEGNSNPQDSKTASGVIRYRGDEVVAVLDSRMAGRFAGEVFGVGNRIPFIDSLSRVEADTLLVGTALAGGGLPPEWRPIFREAIQKRMAIVSGLHFFLGEDPEIAELARERGVEIFDLRKPPPDLTVSSNVARDLSCFRVQTVGNDCNVGKMLTALEVTSGLQAKGKKARFVATGQTGIMIAGWGIPIDRVVSDFISGAIEKVILDHQHEEFLLIEGQGSLTHPLFSGVTLGLLHGAAPQAMIMCYVTGRREIRHANMAVPPLKDVIQIYETMANLIAPSRVIGIAVNTRSLDAAGAERELKSTEDAFQLPTTDVIREGSEKLVETILETRGGAAS